MVCIGTALLGERTAGKRVIAARTLYTCITLFYTHDKHAVPTEIHVRLIPAVHYRGLKTTEVEQYLQNTNPECVTPTYSESRGKGSKKTINVRN
jgi:hypothetical protein